MKDLPTLLRSRTMPNNGSVNNGSSNNMHLPDIERRARVEADKAIKERKVFAIVGPYNSLRKSLRRRGWVEKFSDDVIQSLQTKPHTADNDSHRAYPPLRPWEEEGGIYGIMSRLVRNCTPTFVFTVKSVDVDPRVVKSGQLVNHFGKTAHITTKSGLSQNLKNLHWYDLEDADNFYPRCYRLDDIEERDAFKDDFLITAAIGFLKHFMELYGPHDSKWKRHKVNESGDTFNDQPEEAAELKNESKDAEKEPSHDEHGTFTTKGPSIPIQALDMALSFCESYCRKKDHDDIDVIVDSKTPFQSQIDCFLTWFYQFAHSNGEVFGIADTHVKQCSEMLDKISVKWPQFQLDGYQNVWILKPGAKSRGRGIQLMGKLQDILHALESGESCLVIQKYIERPLLIYKTKFDIRQWFLVTDWNPVTIWFYRDCYLRFCSQEYSLADFNVAIHLSNNSVQKHFQNGKRSNKLPDDNMWTREEFSQYLGEAGQKHLWTSRTLAGMKSAIISAVLCTQESIEGRKSAFELYGADFMLDEDFFPWLLEINSSPSMAQTTHVTKVLVENVLEDTLKVVLDRRNDKNCDTGGFEMIYKQTAQVEPVMSDTNLSIQGHKMFIKRTQ